MNSIDKIRILDRIIEHYKLKSKAELARFLEVKPQTVSSWYRRKTVDYDLLFEKCSDMDFNELVRGFKQNQEKLIKQKELSYLEEMLEKKDEKIIKLSERIGELKQQLKQR